MKAYAILWKLSLWGVLLNCESWVSNNLGGHFFEEFVLNR